MINHADPSQSPPLDAVTGLALIERVQALERAVALGFVGISGQSVELPERQSVMLGSSEGISDPPSYESPPPSWRS